MKMKKTCTIVVLLFAASLLCVSPADAVEKDAAAEKGPKVVESLDVAKVPASFPVGFCLLTQGNRQYVAYYDVQRRMVVASRTVDSKKWKYQIIPEKVAWDSHNRITMAADDDGYLHLSGNMHNRKLMYFRTSKPWDITTFKRLDRMLGKNEGRCTYPGFMRGPKGELIFSHRDGGSGTGRRIYNVYDLKTQTWRRMLENSLIDGEGKMSAYYHGPVLGPDGYYHICWVWRDTAYCETSHDVLYARSRDLRHWETIAGKPVELPMTSKTKGLLVADVPVRTGLINGANRIGFDRKQVLVGYHKFDKDGNTQVYIARYENGAWVSHKITDWKYRWDLHGLGSMVFHISMGSLEPRLGHKNELMMPYEHIKYGKRLLILDEKTLKLLGTAKPPVHRPLELYKLEDKFPGMRVNWREDLGSSGKQGVRYVLRWETLPTNHDRPRTGPLPAPSMLRVYKLSANHVVGWGWPDDNRHGGMSNILFVDGHIDPYVAEEALDTNGDLIWYRPEM